MAKVVETERRHESYEEVWPSADEAPASAVRSTSLARSGVVEPTAVKLREIGEPWPAYILPIILGGLVVFLYWPVIVPMAWQWSDDPNYSHGFLIPMLSAYFAWERRDRLAVSGSIPSWWGLPVLLLALTMLALGQIGAELFLQRVSLVAVIAGLVLMTMGREALKLCSFPIVFLLFMVPLPAIVLNAVAFPLQLFAAQAAATSLMALDIPVLREGNVISLATTTLEVAEACSGIRSLMSLVALATVYAYFTEGVMWKRWLIIVAAVPVAIAANAFRVAGTGVLAHYFGDEAAQGFYHDFSGWLVFVVAFVLLLGVGLVVRGWKGRPAKLRERAPEVKSE